VVSSCISPGYGGTGVGCMFACIALIFNYKFPYYAIGVVHAYYFQIKLYKEDIIKQYLLVPVLTFL
jgi:hypothetical protein